MHNIKTTLPLIMQFVSWYFIGKVAFTHSIAWVSG
jgi:hypothetical protein